MTKVFKIETQDGVLELSEDDMLPEETLICPKCGENSFEKEGLGHEFHCWNCNIRVFAKDYYYYLSEIKDMDFCDICVHMSELCCCA